ncbi:ADP-ribosylglycohydrolase [compost metagenome]
MKNSLADKVHGSLLGLAIGDALGAPVEGWSAEQIQRKHGWVDDFLIEQPVGTDDTEFAMLTAQLLVKYGDALRPEDVRNEWKELIDLGVLYGGGFSEAAAILNLKKGYAPPLTGLRNPEMWSDGTAMRVAPIGIYCAGDPEKAARLAAIDGEISHSKDGIFSAQAVAASVSIAMVNSNVDAVLQAGMAAIPQDCWTSRILDRALDLATGSSSLQDAARRLHDQLSIHAYYWVDVGPEAVALAFGSLAAAKGVYKDSVVCSVNCGRDADTIAAISGGISGAMHGLAAIPQQWVDRIGTVRGKCIGSLAGVDIRSIAAQLVDCIRR